MADEVHVHTREEAERLYRAAQRLLGAEFGWPPAMRFWTRKGRRKTRRIRRG